MYQNIQLFNGIEPEQIQGLFDCISAYTKSFKRGEFLLMAGDKVKSIGIVMSGSVNVVKENLYGDRRIMMTAEQNDIFAESIAASDITRSPVSVVAKQDCTILFVPIERLMVTCGSSCAFHNKLIHNLVAILAVKNLFLNQKIDYLSAKNTREKIAKYLGDFISVKKSTTVTIPYNRNDLAEYLGVDRSVLSRELSKLKKEGVLDFNKNTFTIIRPDTLSALYA